MKPCFHSNLPSSWGWNTRLARFAAHTAAAVIAIGKKHVPRQKKIGWQESGCTIDLLRFFLKISVFFSSQWSEVKICWVVCWEGPGLHLLVCEPRDDRLGPCEFLLVWRVDCCRTPLVPNFVGHVGHHFFSKSPAAVDRHGNGVATKDMASRAACWPNFYRPTLRKQLLQLIVLCFTCAVDSLKATQTKLMPHTSCKIHTSFWNLHLFVCLAEVVTYNLYWWCVSDEYGNCPQYAAGKGFQQLYSRLRENGPFDLIGFQECDDVGLVGEMQADFSKNNKN